MQVDSLNPDNFFFTSENSKHSLERKSSQHLLPTINRTPNNNKKQRYRDDSKKSDNKSRGAVMPDIVTSPRVRNIRDANLLSLNVPVPHLGGLSYD